MKTIRFVLAVKTSRKQIVEIYRWNQMETWYFNTFNAEYFRADPNLRNYGINKVSNFRLDLHHLAGLARYMYLYGHQFILVWTDYASTVHGCQANNISRSFQGKIIHTKLPHFIVFAIIYSGDERSTLVCCSITPISADHSPHAGIKVGSWSTGVKIGNMPRSFLKNITSFFITCENVQIFSVAY